MLNNNSWRKAIIGNRNKIMNVGLNEARLITAIKYALNISFHGIFIKCKKQITLGTSTGSCVNIVF